MRRLTWLGFALAAVWLVAGRSAQAQARVEFTAHSANYHFGEQLVFSAEFSSTPVILEGYVFYQVEDDERIWVYEGEISRGRLDVLVTLDEANQPRAFTTIQYWFRIASDHGEFFESPVYSFYYDDNRFVWQQAALSPFRLLWHDAPLMQAAAILPAARQSVARVQAVLPLPSPQPLTLRVYQQAVDAQRAAELAHYPWADGYAPPDQNAWLLAHGPQLERQVTHALAQRMLYEGLGAQGYANLPAWLSEGIASLAESSVDPQEAAVLQAAAQAGGLLPVYILCTSLPQDAVQNHLARLQSAALVRYLLARFNKTGFGILVEAYARSGDCIQAPQTAFGVNLLQLEQDWHTALNGGEPGWLANIDWRSIGQGAAAALGLWALLRLAGRGRRA